MVRKLAMILIEEGGGGPHNKCTLKYQYLGLIICPGGNIY